MGGSSADGKKQEAKSSGALPCNSTSTRKHEIRRARGTEIQKYICQWSVVSRPSSASFAPLEMSEAQGERRSNCLYGVKEWLVVGILCFLPSSVCQSCLFASRDLSAERHEIGRRETGSRL